MNNLKNNISLNLISLTGLIFFLFCIIVFFILLPLAKNYDIIHNNSEILARYELFNSFWKILMYYIIVEFILIVLGIIEFLIYINFKNVNLVKLILKKNTNVLNSVIFYSGIIFAIIPFCFFIYQYIEYVLTTHKFF
ncbi:MAG: hypothetical protein BHW64_03115 [Candidatus Melainabacteria bacterium LEY3_CP_29_8]|nr:MAG: hypothetical protein BHW64_03115 [Candidatus Melainabacteria bacterium LEY3_CP_29_8]